MADLSGTVVDGRYRVLRRIGAGGMGEVWLAHQQSLGRDVALKVIRGDAGADDLERFRREARAISKVRHDNVVMVLDCGGDGASAFIAMELLDGETLRDRMRRGAAPWREGVDVARQMFAALGAAHAAGIVHRDVKPENVILVVEPRGRVKLLDFGIARTETAGETLTQTGMFVGTPAYAAPEVVLGERNADARSDIYAAGVVLWELLAGRPMYDEKNAVAIALKKTQAPAPRISAFAAVPRELDDLVATLVDRDAALRPTIPHVLASLSRLLDGPVAADPAPTPVLAHTAAREALASSPSSSPSPPPSAPPAPSPSGSSLSSATVTATANAPISSKASAKVPGTLPPPPPDRRVVHENPWVRMELDDARKTLWVRRTPKKLEAAECDAALSCFAAPPAGVGYDTHALIVDFRETSGSNDPEFEKKSDPWFERLGAYTIVAMLARTAVGRLGIARHRRTSTGTDHFHITDSEADAYAHIERERNKKR